MTQGMEGTISTPLEVKPRAWQRWLNYALQALWIVALVYVVQLYLGSIRLGYAELVKVCTEPVCPEGQLTQQGVASLRRLGLSTSTYAVLQLFLVFGIAAIYATVSVLIFRAKRHENIAIYVALVMLLYGAFVSDYVAVLRQVQPQLADLVDVVTGLTLIAFAILCYVFPDGRFVPRWSRWAAWGWVAAPLILTVATMFDAYDLIEGPISVVLLGLLATCIISPVYRYRTLSSYTQRQQLKWVLIGLAQLLAMLLIGVELMPMVFPMIDVPGTLPNIVFNLVAAVSLAIFPLTVGIALLRYRLWNVDLVINRTLVYVPLTSILTVIYTTSMAVSQRIFTTATGEQSQAVAIFTTIVLTTTFSPIKNALQAYVDKNFKEAPGQLKPLKELNVQVAQVVQALDHRSLAQRIVETIVQANHARGAALYLREENGGQPKMVLAYATPGWVWTEGEVSILLAADDAGQDAADHSPDHEIYGRLLLGQRTDRDDYTLDEIEEIRATTVPLVANMRKLHTIYEDTQ